MSLGWKLRRLRSMEPGEILYRTGQVARTSLARLGIGLAPDIVEIPPASLPTPPECRLRIDDALYRSRADEILAGRFRIFALQPVELGFPPRWNRDPRTGTLAPLAFGQTLDYRDESVVGNIKYLWEPNRHLELVTLAQAWHLTGDERYAVGCRTLLGSWFEQCPYPRGPNWTSSLELGIRLVNWAYAWRLLGGPGSPVFREAAGWQFRTRWLTSIYQHCHFISRHLSRYSSANNHLLGELLGVFVASTAWPAWRESERWRSWARAEFEREALLQNAPDGVNREQGIWYHHEVTDMMLIAAVMGRANGIEFSTGFWDRLETMLEFIASLMDVGGNVPAIGDSDDAVIVRFVPDDRFNVYRSLLATGAVLFERGDFRAKAGAFDDKSRWLLGDAGADAFERIAPTPPAVPVRAAFPDGGYYVLGSNFETDHEVRIVADAGPLGYLSIAAHGHADALSLTLSVSGRPILIDPGTYAYHTERAWRDYFRGTMAHNTVRIDGVDQSVTGGAFLWMTHATSRLEAFEVSGELDRFVATHDGYCRLRDPVVHRREVRYSKQKHVLDVVDRLHCRGLHDVEILWHFAPECRISVLEQSACIEIDTVRLTLAWPSGFVGQVGRGSVEPVAGWTSRGFDTKEACATLTVKGTVRGDWEGTTRMVVAWPRV